LAYTVGYVIDEIPLIGNFFEIVGLGYTTWFTSRYLLSAPARQQLWAKFFPPATDKPLQPTQSQPDSAENSIAGVVGTVQVVIPLKGVVDIEAVRAKLEKSLNKAEAEAQSLNTRLSNAKFVDKAPKDVVQSAREALAEAQKQAEILRERLRGLV
jgi:valyl-tRNA synthetase